MVKWSYCSSSGVPNKCNKTLNSQKSRSTETKTEVLILHESAQSVRIHQWISDVHDLMIARIVYPSLLLPLYTPTEDYQEANCIDSDLRTKCKSNSSPHPEYSSALKLELQGLWHFEIRSVTIHSPLEETSYQADGRVFKVRAKQAKVTS